MYPLLEKVVPVGDYRLWLEFRDGVKGEIDVSKLVAFTGHYFTPLKNKVYFRRVRLVEGGSGIEWPNEADICPHVLYSAITGKSDESRGASSPNPKYTNPTLKEARRLGIVHQTIDAVAAALISKHPTKSRDDLLLSICKVLPWCDPRAVVRRVSLQLGSVNQVARRDRANRVAVAKPI